MTKTRKQLSNLRGSQGRRTAIAPTRMHIPAHLRTEYDAHQALWD